MKSLAEGSVQTTTGQCTVTSGSTCSVNIPSAVTSSNGYYASVYAGLNTSYGADMSPDVAKTATSVTLSANTSYYSIYSSPVTIYKPTSTSACNSTNTVFYRNQWLASNSALADTVLSSTATGTTNNASYTSDVSGYSVYGFAGAASTIDTKTLTALKTSNDTTAYAVLYKSVEATFYYSNSTAGAKTSVKASSDQ
jgi:hypothetical protein